MTTIMKRTPRKGGGGESPSIVLLLAVAMVSFFAGTLVTVHLGLDSFHDNINNNNNNNNRNLENHQLNAKVEELAQKRLLELQKASPNCNGSSPSISSAGGTTSSSSSLKFPDTTQKYAVGMARTSKIDFFQQIDLGVPMDVPKDGDSDVLILYSRSAALPTGYSGAIKTSSSTSSSSSSIPAIDMKDAVENCEFVNVILTDHGSRNQCIAIVPQYESYHIQKWLRVGKDGIDKNQDLKLVSRGYQSNGRNQFEPPNKVDMRKSWDLLAKYFQAFDEVMAELKPLVEKVATAHRTVTVMVCNFGQSELLANFVCSARSRNLDTSSILVFATDPETKELAESLGLTAYYDERNFGDMPSEAALRYGDRKFTAMMMAKVMCVQMVSALKYNILFQDVDIIWYKDPIKMFEEKESHLQEFDMLFQDDGGHSVRYAPYSANSGFYYVRYNSRTEHFFNSLLLAGDLILKTDSHQQALIALMSEHVSLYGLRVKVFSRDEEEFPGGYQFHQKTGKYMRALFAGKLHPYLLHMSWTKNKDNKLKFFQQIGEWYVREECVQKKVGDLAEIGAGDSNGFANACCAAEPIIKCHYRDKPSKFPCTDSPPIDEGRPSFW